MKRAADIIAEPIRNLVDLSFKQGIFPDHLKTAIVTPIYKSGDKQSLGNYRPISILRTLSKVLEKCMVKRMMSFLSKYSIITPHQYGFLPGLSTFNAINSILEHVYDAFNEKQHCVSVFLDLKKAFDTVDHCILLRKLEYYGFRGKVLSWFASYLKNRTQKVRIGNTLSDTVVTNIGIPQGSNIGPVLFLIFINDCTVASDVALYSLFADDTALSFKSTSMFDLINSVNTELTKVYKWLQANKLTLNTAKTEWILFSTAKGYVVPQNGVLIDNLPIARVYSVKYLGVLIDSNLNFCDHIIYISKKVSKTLGVLFRLRNLLSIEARINLYYALIYPYIMYCILVWGKTYDSHLNRLILLQKKIVRIITNSAYDAHTLPLFYQTKILKIKDVYKYFLGQYSFTSNLEGNFTYPTHDINTRNAGNPIPQFARLNITQRSLKYCAPSLFNSLPSEIRNCNKIPKFKKMYRNYLLEGYSET